MDTLDTTTPRRGFLSRLIAGLAGASVAVVARPDSTMAQGGAQQGAETHPHDRWLDPLTAPHRQIYDVLSFAGKDGLAYARNFLVASADAYGTTDSDVNVVVSLRHHAIPIAFGDVMWAAYQVGDYFNVDDPETKARAVRNPFLGKEGDTSRMSPSFRALVSHRVIFTVCGMALRRVTSDFATKYKRPYEKVRAEWDAAMLPGAIVVPAGVIAVNRAQERGFSYVYAG